MLVSALVLVGIAAVIAAKGAKPQAVPVKIR